MADLQRWLTGASGDLAELGIEQVPRRFVIWAENDDETTGEILGWGMTLPDGAVVSPVGEGLATRFSSVERALWLHSAVHTARLTWIDRPPPDTGGAT